MSGRIATSALESRALLLLLALLSFARLLQADERAKLVWSTSLERQGFRSATWGGPNFTGVGGVAPTKEIIGVAIGNHPEPSEKKFGKKPWEVSLLLYESKSGKFLGRKGPWESGPGFRVVPTSDQKLIVFLAPYQDGSHITPGRLLLFSSTGEEIKQLVLDFGELPSLRINFLESPDLSTVLVGARMSSKSHYRVLDADGLETKLAREEETSQASPLEISISDEQMLGVSNFNAYFVRDFKTSWKSFPNGEAVPKYSGTHSFLPNSPYFLQNRVFVGRAYESVNEVIVPIIREDGTILSVHSAGKLPDYNFFIGFSFASQDYSFSGGTRIVSRDGKFFGLFLQHENRLAHWWDYTADMGPLGASYFLNIWQADGDMAPIQIQTSPRLTAASFFSTGDAKMAILDGDKLKVFSFSNVDSRPSSSLP